MAEYRIRLEPRNPGQFFACCGLFELAELCAPSSMASFAEDGTVFLLETTEAVALTRLELEPQPDLDGKPYDETLEPLILSVGKHQLSIDWWLNETRTEKSGLKTWGGQQTPRRVLEELLQLLDYEVPLQQLFESPAYTKSRFGVDGRSAWEALDAGYSPNDVGQAAITFPWVEVLAVAGLQGFRPVEAGRNRYRYWTWHTLLPLIAARAACAAPWLGLGSNRFTFNVAVRGQGYKTFLFAEGANHD